MFDHKAEEANAWLKQKGLPLLAPVDSVPQWSFIVTDRNGRPGPMHLSENALLHWPFKLVTGKQVFSTWTGPVYPNCSTVDSLEQQNGPLPAQQDVKIFGEKMPIASSDSETDRQTWTKDCGEGCLMNVQTDPTEHSDLAGDPAYAETLKSMQDTLKELNKDLFQPDRGVGRLEGCQVALDQGRVFGPFVSYETFYSPAPPRTQSEKVSDAVLG